MMYYTKQNKILEYMRERGVVIELKEIYEIFGASDIDQKHKCRACIAALKKDGKIDHIGYGLYKIKK